MLTPRSVPVIAILYASTTAGASGGAIGAELKPATVAAFDAYVRLVESRTDDEVRRPDAFLYLDTLDGERRRAAEAAVRKGDIIIDPLKARDRGKAVGIPDGRVHHWIGVGFVPGVRLTDAVKLLQDYDRHAEIYQPAVQRSKVLARDGERFRVFLRFYQKKGIAVTVNSEHEAEFFRAGEDRVHSRIRSTRIAEVADAGKPGEHEKPVGRDGGYLWRLNTYWRFLQRDGGTYVQCESITLTRDIPFGLGFLVGPFVNSIPRETLTFTMERTREALRANTSVR
jgi:hypothetical protein